MVYPLQSTEAPVLDTGKLFQRPQTHLSELWNYLRKCCNVSSGRERWHLSVPPTTLAPAGPYIRTVIVNGIYPILDQDVLTPHQSPTTNIVMVGPCGQTPPVPMPCICSMLTTEDAKGVGHPRKLTALTKTVYAMGLAMGKVADPLGPPCLSVISQVVQTYS